LYMTLCMVITLQKDIGWAKPAMDIAARDYTANWWHETTKQLRHERLP